jgi:hypothetical protein
VGEITDMGVARGGLEDRTLPYGRSINGIPAARQSIPRSPCGAAWTAPGKHLLTGEAVLDCHERNRKLRE